MPVGGSCSVRTRGRRIRRSVVVISFGSQVWCGVEGTYGGVVGLSDQTVVVLAVELDDFAALGVETSIDGESCEQSCCCNGESLSVDHLDD